MKTHLTLNFENQVQVQAGILKEVVKWISVFVLPLATVATVTIPKGDD